MAAEQQTGAMSPADQQIVNEADADAKNKAQMAEQLISEIDAELARRGEAPEGEATEVMVEEETEVTEEGAEDLSALEEALGMAPERAKKIYDAAQQYGKTQGKSPQELADMIANDFDVLMQLEMIAARGEEAQPQEAMQEQQMPADAMMPAGMEPQGGM